MFLNRLINIPLFCLLQLLLNGRVFTDGPFSFNVASQSTVEVVDSFFEINGNIKAEYLIQLNNKPSPIGLKVRSVNSSENLYSNAAHREKTWVNSEKGNMLLAEEFTSSLGYRGFSLVRQTANSELQPLEDYFIILDLSQNESNASLVWVLEENENNWLRIEFSAISELAQESSYEVALAIAQTVSYQKPTTEDSITFSEVINQNDESNATLTQFVSDGPISLIAPKDSDIDHISSYREYNSSSLAIYSIESLEFDLPFNLSIETESSLPNLETASALKKRAFEKSEIGTLEDARYFTSDLGFRGALMAREVEIEELGIFFDYWIILDLTTTEWLDRYPTENGTPPDIWLKATFSGVLVDEKSYNAAEMMAKSLDFNRSYLPETDTYEDGPKIDLSQLNSPLKTITDGPISFTVNSSSVVDYVSAYRETDMLSQASYLIYSKNQELPFALSLSTERNFKSINEWGVHQKKSWISSNFGTLDAAQSFNTNQGDNGILILRSISDPFDQTISFIEFVINVDLVSESWRNKFSESSETPWLRVQLVGYFDSIENGNFYEALEVAKSLSFNDLVLTESSTFEKFSSTFSPSTQIPVREISNNWFESTWFGAFYDYQNNWVYHPKLGWIYCIPSSLEGIWIWSPSAKWLWGNSLTYPYLFSEKSRDWIFLNSENKTGALAYDFDQEIWSNWSTLNLRQRKFSPGEQRVEIDRIYYSDKPHDLKVRKISEIIYNGLR
jgi:hypothetical protein